jgi:hypothetical protein
MRDHYSMATEEQRWAVTSAPHDGNYACGCVA